MTPIRVMIIDDDEIDRYLATRTLKKFDVFGEIVEFPDGRDAADLMQEPDFIQVWGPPPPTLILLDINMPRMSGFEFLDYVAGLDSRVAGNWTGFVFLMLTSSGNERDRTQAGSYHFVKGYIEKPITTDKVRTILDGGHFSLANP